MRFKGSSKFLSLLIVLLLLLMAGCGQSGTTGQSQNESSNGQNAVSDTPKEGQKDLEKVTLSVGRQPYAAENSPITKYMIDNKLFEKYAADLGYELTVDWRDYPNAGPMVSAMIGNNLDFGMWGDTPIIRMIAEKQPISVISLGEGHLEFLLITRKDSGIRNFEDLKGRTVGLQKGGDPHFAFTSMLNHILGSPNPEDFDINVVNAATHTVAGSLPAGMDASVTILPEYLKAHRNDPNVVSIASSYGYTGIHYDGKVGKGEGHVFPEVKESQFYPEGFYLHRSLWVARNQVIEKYPKLVQAFVMAEQEAINQLKKMSPAEIVPLSEEYWKLPTDSATEILDKSLLLQRGWVWPTQGDIQALVYVSKNLADVEAIKEPISWEDVKENMKITSKIMEDAYNAMNKYPEHSEFTKEGVEDYRGLPIWEMDQWKTNQ